MGVKIGKKRKLSTQNVESDEEEKVELPPPSRSSDEPIPKKVKWINKQRVLVVAARGISYRHRHLMTDLRDLMPHCRTENKMEKKEHMFIVNEVCEEKNCNKAVMFEGRMKRDLYMWLANTPSGPSAKFLVENVYTMAELKLTGNCLKSSRPLLSFDAAFDAEPHYQLLKEILIQIFGIPNGHPKSQPFVDHVLTFSILDNRIWFRNYQILAEDGALAEIGPRFALNPIKIFDGSFGGATLWDNPHYVSPAKHRRLMNKTAASKYLSRITQKTHQELDRPETSYALNDGNDIFAGDAFEKAQDIVEREEAAEEESMSLAASGGDSEPKKKRKKKGVNKPKISESAEEVSELSKSNGLSPKIKKGKSSPLAKVKKIKNKRIATMKAKKVKSKAKTLVQDQ